MGLSLFNKFFTKKRKKHTPTEIKKIRLVILAFDDNCLTNSGKILFQYLENNPLLSVAYYDEPFDTGFLDLQGRNFFDLIDTGNRILKKTDADVLVWGYREHKNIRLNFQTSDQYKTQDIPSFSLLNSLYLPLENFQNHELGESIIELIFSVILTAYKSSDYSEILQQAISRVNNSSPPKNIGVDCMPYILNLLALAYLNSVKHNLAKSDVKAISSILRNALNYKGKNGFEGIIYTNLGQLYHIASDLSVNNKYENCKIAIDCYTLAQKYFNRHTYPYDFASLAYKLSKLHFAYWKYTSDIQALRNAVFQLREAQKTFTKIVFPKMWADIEYDLGLYLSMMAIFSKNDEIAMIAIGNYKNCQEIYTADKFPLQWARAQESIANTFFECGKLFNNEEYFEEAAKYYTDAYNIYDEHNMSEQMKIIQISIHKTDKYLLRLNQY